MKNEQSPTYLDIYIVLSDFFNHGAANFDWSRYFQALWPIKHWAFLRYFLLATKVNVCSLSPLMTKQALFHIGETRWLWNYFTIFEEFLELWIIGTCSHEEIISFINWRIWTDWYDPWMKFKLMYHQEEEENEIKSVWVLRCTMYRNFFFDQKNSFILVS